MSAVTFDTLKFVKTLESAGFNAQQAEALANAQQTAISESAELILATKDDTNTIRADVAKVDAEIRLLKWMTGATFAAVMAILIRLFIAVPH
jgi:Holliday junction resolvase-like predicted endonuclease